MFSKKAMCFKQRFISTQQQGSHLVFPLNTCWEPPAKNILKKKKRLLRKTSPCEKMKWQPLHFEERWQQKYFHVVLKPAKFCKGFQVQCMSFMSSVPTWHGMDQVATQHHEPRPGSELVYGLHSLLGELNLLGPFVPSTNAVALLPGLHQPKLGVCGLDEAKWSRPLTFCIWNKKRQEWT